ncbi:receptor lectin kinase, putative [Medicago truncatula]|uniref:Receptor lectin kinase, putative n=1 Tax=Medicago truncatula TaxID=3880 RepID=G7JR77_MEDTR|nr:receptor lectin kinase, putative [Medicago truncatula]
MSYNIVMDLAALLYLHEEWEQCDIKSNNIMLDYIFNVKLGDFRLARWWIMRKDHKVLKLFGRKPTDRKAKDNQVAIFDCVWDLYRLGKLLEVIYRKLGHVFDEEQLERLVVIGLYGFLKFEPPLPMISKMFQSTYPTATMSSIFYPVSFPFPAYSS